MEKEEKRTSVFTADWSIYFLLIFFELLSLSVFALCLLESHFISLPSLSRCLEVIYQIQTCRWNKTRPGNLFCCFCLRSFPLLCDDIHLSAASASLKWIHLPLSRCVSAFLHCKENAVWQQMLKDEMRIGVVMTQWVQLYSRNIKSDSWLHLCVISPFLSLTAVIKTFERWWGDMQSNLFRMLFQSCHFGIYFSPTCCGCAAVWRSHSFGCK